MVVSAMEQLRCHRLFLLHLRMDGSGTHPPPPSICHTLSHLEQAVQSIRYNSQAATCCPAVSVSLCPSLAVNGLINHTHGLISFALTDHIPSKDLCLICAFTFYS
jgi:hypothetical protein